jgi:hypothetical protein
MNFEIGPLKLNVYFETSLIGFKRTKFSFVGIEIGSEVNAHNVCFKPWRPFSAECF